jgi:hypothetical protein
MTRRSKVNTDALLAAVTLSKDSLSGPCILPVTARFAKVVLEGKRPGILFIGFPAKYPTWKAFLQYGPIRYVAMAGQRCESLSPTENILRGRI